MRKFLAALFLLALAGLPVHAASPDLSTPVDEETVTGLMDIARLLLPQVRMPDGTKIPEETEAERKKPLLDRTRARKLVNAGRLSAAGDWCVLDWDALVRSAAMKAIREDASLTPKQAVYAGVLHDTALGAWQSEFVKMGDCDAKDKATLQNLLNRFKF